VFHVDRRFWKTLTSCTYMTETPFLVVYMSLILLFLPASTWFLFRENVSVLVWTDTGNLFY
jgi:hypothetical protein